MSSKIVKTLRSKLRLRNATAREFLAEFLGTFVLISFGNASVAQHVLGGPSSSMVGVHLGWGVGVGLAVLSSVGVSGGHVNPSVTLALALRGRLPWHKVPPYMVAQYLGAFLASALVYAVYFDALEAFEGGRLRTAATAGIWATYPGSVSSSNGTAVGDFLSSGNGFADQVVGTMLLLICVSAISDPRNAGVPRGLVPASVGAVVLGVGVSFGANCGYAVNPARDLAPRLFSSLAGWGDAPFRATTKEGVAWWWVPVVGPHVGAILGALAYLLLVEVHHPEGGALALPKGEEEEHAPPRESGVAGLGTNGKYSNKKRVMPQVNCEVLDGPDF